MTSTTAAPPGTLTGPRPPHPNGIGIPGYCHLELLPGHVCDHEWVATDTRGQHNDGDLVIGETLAHGPIRLHYETVAQLRALALAATRLADWLEAS